MSAGSHGTIGPPTWMVFIKHQTSSIITTVVDFVTMIAAHELLRLSPSWSTVVGATCGAIANFMLGRHWTFRAAHGRPHGQAVKYALVAAASLGLNALGELLLAERLHVQYVVARLAVAATVSVFWNFPMQRVFVFAQKKRVGES